MSKPKLPGVSRRHFLYLTAMAGSAYALTGCSSEKPAPSSAGGPPEVLTAQGHVRGVVKNGIASFKGIPYAEPPVGKRRFRPPVRVARWDGVRDAARFGQVSPQLDDNAF